MGSGEVLDEEVIGGSVTEVDDDVGETDDEELAEVELVGPFTNLQVAVPAETVRRGVCPRTCPRAFSTRSEMLVPAAKTTCQFIEVAIAGAVPMSYVVPPATATTSYGPTSPSHEILCVPH